jgi:hypothetical protein
MTEKGLKYLSDIIQFIEINGAWHHLFIIHLNLESDY